MTEVKEIKINVPIPVSKTRKSKKQALADKGALLQEPSKPIIKTGVLSSVKIGGKQTISVPLPYAKSINTPSPVKPVVKSVLKQPIKLIEKTPVRKAPSTIKVNVQPIKRKNFTLKRKFTAKKITIQVENSNKIKKNRENIENIVKNMDLKEITNKLREKNLVRHTSNPPEQMQRNMMIDIMMFPKPL